MNVMALDTHAFVKRPTAAGMPEAQAEAVTTLVTAAREADHAHFVTTADLAGLATRDDVAALRSEVLATKADVAGCATKSELAAVEAGLRFALEQLKSELQEWTFGLVGGALVLNAVTVVGAMLVLVKLLGH